MSFITIIYIYSFRNVTLAQSFSADDKIYFCVEIMSFFTIIYIYSFRNVTLVQSFSADGKIYFCVEIMLFFPIVFFTLRELSQIQKPFRLLWHPCI